jgi:hypothetical protein
LTVAALAAEPDTTKTKAAAKNSLVPRIFVTALSAILIDDVCLLYASIASGRKQGGKAASATYYEATVAPNTSVA